MTIIASTLKRKIEDIGKSLSIELKTDSDLRETRLSICKNCEHLYTPTTTCKKCGCFMNAKTWIKNSSCPLNKW